MTSTLLGGPGIEREILENGSLECGTFLVDVWERKHQRWNTKPIEMFINEVESEGMRERESRCKT